MCTALSYRPGAHYFGRNLDLDLSYQEQVVVTPRSYPFQLKNGAVFHTRLAMIGMATVMNQYPLYYEAANEKGLCMAGLNFPNNAFYGERQPDLDNITPFELIPWILGQAETVAQARSLLEHMALINIPFSPQIPLAPLHFMVSDRNSAIVVEPMADGLKIYDNPYDIMTNNPPFDYHLWNLKNYRHLCPENRENRFSTQYDLTPYAAGMGAMGLPGDASSASRFVRGAFHLANSRQEGTELEHVTQCFHILDSIAMVKGSTITENGTCDVTLYSCCIDTDNSTYYYKTYHNNQLTAVRLTDADAQGSQLRRFDLRKGQQVQCEN